MRRALVLVVLLGGGAFAQDADLPASERAFVEVDLPRETCFVEETVRLRVRVGLDAAFFRSQAIPMFRRELDVAAKLDSPWLRSIDGAVLVGEESSASADTRPRLSVAVNDEVVAAARAEDRSVGGRAFTVLEIERTLVPTAPGEIVLTAPVLRFVYATRFDEDFIRGRTAADRREALVEGTPHRLLVRALPETGRPAGFTGAVGRFTVTAGSAARTVTAGESFRLSLTIEGDGNLGRFPAPVLGDLAGFHVYGAIDDKGDPRRTITYDLAALGAGVKEIPAIRFAYFDPAPPGTYREIATAPIPLVVRPAASDANPSAAASRGRDGTGSGGRTIVVVLAIVAAIGAALAVAWRRGRRTRTADPERARADGAAAAFRARTASADADLADAFAEFLASHLRCTPPAVITPDLPGRLARAGLPDGLADRAASTIERLVAARYGGGGSPRDEASAARSLVDELDAAFRAAAAR